MPALSIPVLSPEDEHHLLASLRIRDGETVTASDGKGSWVECVAAVSGARRAGGSTRSKALVLEPVASPVTAPPNPIKVEVAFALTAPAGIQMIVQKLTEAGVDTITPLVSERCASHWKDGSANLNADRLQRIILESAMQSRRTVLPLLKEPTVFDSVAQDVHGTHTFLCDLGASRSILSALGELDRVSGTDGSIVSEATGSTVRVLVGPEGGFSDSEVTSAPQVVSLSDCVMRAETAAIAAGVICCAWRSSQW